MTGNPASVSVLALAGCLVCPGILSAQDGLRAQHIQLPSHAESDVVQAEPPASPSQKKPPSAGRKIGTRGEPGPREAGLSTTSEKMLDFDLPAQELAAALDQYAILVGRSVVVRDALVKGRTSSAVRGPYTPEAALHILLLNTGLMAESLGAHTPDAFVLKPVSTMAAGNAPAELNRSYDGLLQARVWEALCRDPRTSPGTYRSILRFYIDQSGRLRKTRLLVGTGNGQRDAAMLAVLTHVRIEIPPPPDLVQPLTLILLPADVMAGRTCDSVH